MLKSFLFSLPKIPCRPQFSNRNVKAFKFLPPSVKTTISDSNLPPPTKIDKETVELLERLSLVGFEDEKAIQIVEDAIRFADYIFDANTDEVKPLVTVLEDQALPLREDAVKVDVTRAELLSHSTVTEENYFVTPIGNKEYIPEHKSLKLEAKVSDNV